MPNKIAVTGGTGFVGAHVVRKLVERGDIVRALARPSSRLDNLNGLGVEVVLGDLNDLNSLKNAFNGCDSVLHVAADYRLWSKNPQDLYDSNVNGAKNVMAACESVGASKIVYTSTVGALGIPTDGTSGNEETPVSLADMVGHYKRSKFLAEQAVLEYVSEKKLPVVIVNPSTPVGDLDIKPTPTGKMIVDFLNGKMPGYMDTGLNLVDVHDVAEGHLLALDRGVVGRKYILGNKNMSLQAILQELATLTGRKAPKMKFPYSLAYAVSAIDTAIEGTLLGKNPQIALESVKMTRKRMYFDASRAVNELGFPQSSIADALARAIDWFRKNGYAK